MRGFVGNFFHAPGGVVEYLESCLVIVDDEGILVDVIEKQGNEEIYEAKIEELKGSEGLEEGSEHSYFLPGFIDLHVHAPQFPNMGTGLYLPLEQWLNEITFPLEATFQDIEQAKLVYPRLVSTLLSHGTTCALYFSSIHADSTIELAKICLKHGQRAFVGKVCMDNEEQCPTYYIDTTENNINDTKRVIKEIHSLSDSDYEKRYGKQGKGDDSRLVRPVITPRFIPSCTDKLLQGLGDIAKQNPSVVVQSHCSESNWAVQYCKERFGKSDSEVYHGFGLLRNKSVWAHSVFLSDTDVELFRLHKAGIAHCPLSNFYFANAGFTAKRIRNLGVDRIGLGSDISGGYSPSLFDACRQAVVTSLALEEGIDGSRTNRGVPDSRISIEQAFYMATMGGALALGIDHLVGSFEIGKAFDAQLVKLENLPTVEMPSTFSKKALMKQKFEKLMHATTREHIQRVWVAGNLVFEKK